MKDHNHITIKGWMINRLGLSGNELLIYAIIYGYSQDEISVFKGSGKYLADSLGISRRAVFLILEKLVKDGFIKKIEKFERNLKFCDYRASPEFFPKDAKKGGGEKISPLVNDFSMDSGENFSPPVQNLPESGEKTAPVSGEIFSPHITNTYLNHTTTTAAERPDLSEKPPPQAGTAAAAVLSPEDIKAALLAIDRALLLKTDFYSRAAAFLALNYLDKGYLAWLYEQCELRKPDSFEGLYHTLFFAENMAEKYKILKQPPPPSPPVEIKCPVCGAVHNKQDEKCPLCSLPKDASSEQIAIFRELVSLPPDKRDEYLREESVIYTVCRLDFNKLKNMKNELNKKFGITVNYEEPSRSYHP